jgi:hypothetical protein
MSRMSKLARTETVILPSSKTRLSKFKVSSWNSVSNIPFPLRCEAQLSLVEATLRTDIQVDAVLDILVKIGYVLDGAVISINALITGKALGVLSLDGKVLVAADVAAWLSPLIHVCVKAIMAVSDIKVLADIAVVVNACVNIS